MDATAMFKDIPEIFEVDLGEAILARTESLSSFRELGPPDLCYVLKSTGRSNTRDLGSYHYVSGVDASSMASLAAYINSLTYAIEDSNAWFSKSTPWKLKSGTYCCYNAFTRVDMRVDVKIPGGVMAYIVDLRGEKHEATPEIWQETFLSALLRAIIHSDDRNYNSEAYRRLDPITSPEGDIRFLQSAEALFMKGWQVGSDPEIQVATIVSNHLTAGIMKYFGDSGRYLQPVNLFEKLAARDPEVASLLAKSYIGMNEEVKAVQVMAEAIKQTPQSYTLLHTQCDFLRSKGQLEFAAKLAKQAVNCAPSEFVTWEKLTDLHIELGQFESALLTLNSCPMFTFNGRDANRGLPSSFIHLPLEPTGEGILPEKIKTPDDDADPALQRLPAPGLRGTWARAYTLLTRLVARIGWDELLRTRSRVFVMEEEYRLQKAQTSSAANGETSKPMTLVNGDGSREGSADDNASTRGVPDVPSTPGSSDSGESADAETMVENLQVSEGVPEIRISTESDRENEASTAALEKRNDDTKNADGEAHDPKASVATTHALEKPIQAAANEEEENAMSPNSRETHEAFSFTNKRLCERWLDNLFMVLYEDLRVWTIFRAEVAHFKTQQIAYRKTGYEWEILGDLGLRLLHKEDAKDAYQRCLETPRYAQKPWLKLMEMYADEGDMTRTLQTAIRVAAYNHSDYCLMTYPTSISKCLFKLGQIHGQAKVTYSLMSMGLPDPIMKVMESYLSYGKNFKVEGYDF